MIPCIPPVFHDNKSVIDFRDKADFFNTFFAEQCSLPKNYSELPRDLLFLTKKRLSNVQISNENIIKINNLDPNKANGHDMISIRMLKLCGPSLCKPLSIVSNSCLSQVKFPTEWKDFYLRNCRSSLMKMTYCLATNQLFSITHKIYQSFDNDLEVRVVFLEISKAFDKVRHEGLILKLSRNGISGNLLNLLKDFFKIPKIKGAIKWSKLFLERNHFRCSARIYFGTSFVLDLYKRLVGWLVAEL